MIEIHISAHPDRGDIRLQVTDAMRALGFVRETTTTSLASTVADVARHDAPQAAAPAPAVPPWAERPQADPAPRRTRGRSRSADKPVETAPEAERAISSGEERIGPEDDPAEVEAQDRADEEAERAAAQKPAELAKPVEPPAPPPVMTAADIRDALTAYSTAYGKDAVMIDGQAMFDAVLGPAPEGEPHRSSTVPPAQIPAIVERIRAAVETNPFNRKKV